MCGAGGFTMYPNTDLQMQWETGNQSRNEAQKKEFQKIPWRQLQSFLKGIGGHCAQPAKLVVLW